MLFSLRYGLTGQNIFESSGYGIGETEKSALHEYFIAFYFLAILFCDKNSKIQRIVLIALATYFSLKTLIYGGRIEVVQIAILSTLLFTKIFDRENKTFWVLLILGFLTANIFEAVRSDPLMLIDPSRWSFFDTQQVEILANQFGDANQAGARIIGMVGSNELDLTDRIVSFFYVVTGVFHPVFEPPSVWNLAAYKQNEIPSWGGGLLPAFTYAWLGWLGPLIFGCFLGFVYRRLYVSNSVITIAYAVAVSVSFPRWFAYYPAPLFKFCMVIVIALLIYKVLFGKRLALI
jgi:hypothetical protein